LETSTVWLLLYAGLVSINEHPGNTREGARKRSALELASLTDYYIHQYQERFKCPTGKWAPPQSAQ